MEIARYVVAAMLPQHPVKDSHELEERVNEYLGALDRVRMNKRGVPIYRGDGSIGVDSTMCFNDEFKITG